MQRLIKSLHNLYENYFYPKKYIHYRELNNYNTSQINFIIKECKYKDNEYECNYNNFSNISNDR
jgi:hypothetical protein